MKWTYYFYEYQNYSFGLFQLNFRISSELPWRYEFDDPYEDPKTKLIFLNLHELHFQQSSWFLQSAVHQLENQMENQLTSQFIKIIYIGSSFISA